MIDLLITGVIATVIGILILIVPDFTAMLLFVLAGLCFVAALGWVLLDWIIRNET